VFNNGQYGWTSTCAKRLVNYEEFHGSFKSFNDFFTRDIKDVKTTRPLDNSDYVLTAPGDVALSYHAMNVDFNNSLYMKNEKYSLLQIFNNEPSVAQPFVGGAILQVYFSASKYHCYHAPISGQIIYAEKVPGIIYAIDEVNAAKNNDLTGGKSVSSQEKLDLWLELGQNGIIDTEFYLAHVATRCVFVIDSPILGKVGMVFIGMTEISSCTMIKAKGENVEKGEKLGNFQFGGSSGVIAIQKEAVDESKMGENGDNIWRDITGKWLMGQKLVDLTPL
jgi:phosphatidylserine decarboxylase